MHRHAEHHRGVRRARWRRCCRRRRTRGVRPRSVAPALAHRHARRRAPDSGCSSSVSALITCSRWPRGAQVSRPCSCANVRTTSACTQRSRLRATSSSGSRAPSANSAGTSSACAAELADGDLERRPRPERRLLEEQADVPAAERARRRRASCRAGGRALTWRASASSRSRSAWSRSRTERKSLARLAGGGMVLHRRTRSGTRR